MKQNNKWYLWGAVAAACLAVTVWGVASRLQVPEKPYITDSSAILLPGIEWTMEEAVKRSDLIATVEVNEILELKVLGTVKHELMGKSIAKEISIIIDPEVSNIEVGETYLFLLAHLDSFAFPANTYDMSDIDSVYEIQKNGKLSGPSQVADMRITPEVDTLEKLEVYVQNTPRARTLDMPTEGQVKDSYTNLQELFDASDVVVRVSVLEAVPANENVNILEFDVVETFKGTLGREQGQLVPSNSTAAAGKDCYIFYQAKEGGGLFPTARTGAVISTDDTQWSEAEEFLNSLAR